MGGTSTTSNSSTQQSQLTPWAPAQGGIQDILSALSPSTSSLGVTPQVNQAFGQLEANAGNPNPLAAPAMNAGATLLNGGANYGQATGILGSNYNTVAGALTPYLGGNAMDPSSNPALAQQLQTVATQAQNTINPEFAAAGRLGSPANAQALAQGIALGDGGILQNAAANQIGAANALSGAGNSTAANLGSLDATNANILGSGINAASNAYNAQNLGPQALLGAALQQAGLPISNAAALMGILSPVAAQFGQQNGSGSSTGTNTMSGAQQFATIAGGLGNLTRFLWPTGNAAGQAGSSGQ